MKFSLRRRNFLHTLGTGRASWYNQTAVLPWHGNEDMAPAAGEDRCRHSGVITELPLPRRAMEAAKGIKALTKPNQRRTIADRGRDVVAPGRSNCGLIDM